MSSINDKINDALGIDIDKVIDEVDETVSEMDQDEIKKYNERKDIVQKLKQDLKDARSLSNKQWSEALLKNGADNLVVVQETFKQEIIDDPISRNVTAFSEVSNALVNTVESVLDIERQERKLEMSQEKNDLRRMEINNNSGPMIEGSGKQIIGIGSNEDILKMINSGLMDIEGETKIEGDGETKIEGEADASTI
jgi:hypothetical protein